MSYVVEASADAGVTWGTLENLPSNTYVTWAHPWTSPATTGCECVSPAPPREAGRTSTSTWRCMTRSAGIEDFWLFLGDSNTSVVFDGALAGTNRFGAGVNLRLPARWPIALNGGVDGGVMDHYLRTRADPWSDAVHDGTGALLYPDPREIRSL